MKKIILLLFFLCFMFYGEVRATYFYYDDEKVEGMFITRSDGETTKSGNPYILKRRDNDKFVYCLEPLKMLDQENSYLEYDYNDSIFGITNETMDKINLIAYYGYLYPSHEDIKWYGITQYLIWKELYPYLDISFTDARFGNKIVAYTDEVNEVLNLVNRDIVGFNLDSDYDIKTGIEYTLVESELLNNYDVVNDSPMNVYIDGNKLIVKSDYEGNYSFTLKRKNRKDNNYFLYYSSTGQNLFFSGMVEDDKIVNINSENIKLTIIKNDFDGDINNYITLDGARYGIYDLNSNLIVDGLTVDGKVTFSLPRGRYVIMEIEPSYGYNIDMYTYEIDLIDDYEFNVYERKALKKVVIHKQYNDDSELKNEQDIIFYLYKENDIIGKYKTDLNGLITFYLPYGEYTVVQTNSKEGYCFSDNISLKIDENFNEEEILIINLKEPVEEEQPVIEEPVIEEPTIEESAIEEPTIEEPVVEEIKEEEQPKGEEVVEIKEEKKKDVLGASYEEKEYVVPDTSKYDYSIFFVAFILVSLGIYATIKIIV